MPAPRAILAAAVEGAYVDVDTADIIETRYFVSLVTWSAAQNMIKAFFFDLQHINGGGSRPEGYDKFTAKKAWRHRRRNDGRGNRLRGRRRPASRSSSRTSTSTLPSAARGTRRSSRRRLSPRARPPRRRATHSSPASTRPSTPPTSRVSTCHRGRLRVGRGQAQGVPGDRGHRRARCRPGFQHLDPADHHPSPRVKRSEDSIGIHFFSPVDKMPLVEIIKGERRPGCCSGEGHRLHAKDPRPDCCQHSQS